MELIANYTTPEEMLSVDTQKIADLLNKDSRGRFGFDKANQIHQCAKNYLASSSFSLIIRQYLEQLKSLGYHLKSITGVGTTLAIVIFSEIVGDSFLRFPSSLLMPGFIANHVSRVNQKPLGECLLAANVASFKEHLTALGHVYHKMLAIIDFS